MNNVKALKDPYFRREQGIADAEHPAGPVEFSDAELENVNGGTSAPCVWASVRISVAVCSSLYRRIRYGRC